MSLPRRNIVWFRRDLRISDHPALLAAIESSDEIVPVFILDKSQIAKAGDKLLAYMGQSLLNFTAPNPQDTKRNTNRNTNI